MENLWEIDQLYEIYCSFDRFATRFFLATMLCATITLENIYSGQLKSLLTVPLYAAPVDTIEKWAQAQWKWAAPSIIWVHTVEKSDLVTEQILAKNFEVRDYSYMYNASFQHNYGLGIERLASGAFNFGNYVTREAVESRIVGEIFILAEAIKRTILFGCGR